MKQLLLKLMSSTIMKKVKEWLKENGFMGLASLAVAGVAMFLGMWLVVAGSIGFFVGKNWEILRNLWKTKYKEKVEDLVDDVKDKIG